MGICFVSVIKKDVAAIRNALKVIPHKPTIKKVFHEIGKHDNNQICGPVETGLKITAPSHYLKNSNKKASCILRLA